MPADLRALLRDLAAETVALDAIIGPLDEADWRCPTPAVGWTIADQVSHLAYFDDVAVLSATRPQEFIAERDRTEAAGGIDPDAVAARFRDLEPAALRDWFVESRGRLLAEFAGLDLALRVPWYGPPMSVASAVTARLMETWAHGQDIADTLGVQREPTARLRHVAHIGVGARAFSFANRGRPVPCAPVRVELTAPSGELWTWGPDGAPDRISGPALGFCLLVTQRRHLRDAGLDITGPAAWEWMEIAQVFAGRPGNGRAAGQFPADPGPDARASSGPVAPASPVAPDSPAANSMVPASHPAARR